jgi:hypothetical protein
MRSEPLAKPLLGGVVRLKDAGHERLYLDEIQHRLTDPG